MRKHIITAAIIFSFAVSSVSALGGTSDELKTEFDSKSNELDQIKQDKSELSSQQCELMNEHEELVARINELTAEIDELENPTLIDIISDISSNITDTIRSLFTSEETDPTRRERIDADEAEIADLKNNDDGILEQMSNNTQELMNLGEEQTAVVGVLNDLYDEYNDALVAEEEEARLEAERIAAEEEAERITAEEAERAAEKEAAEAETASGNSAVAEATSQSYDMPSGSGVLTWSGGINYFNGHMETWYTMREGTGDLGIPGMYIGTDGIVRDCDGYICVASDDDPKGTIVETSLGTGKVYDCGPGHGIIDIYTDWPLP